MKILKLLVLSLSVTVLIFACKQTETVKEQIQAPSNQEEQKKEQAPSYGEMTGDVAMGKALFSDPAFGSSTNEKSCNICHPDGRGLEKSGEKTEFNIMGMKQNSLEEAVNICIKNPLQGKAIDPKSKDMVDIIAYIKSLKWINR